MYCPVVLMLSASTFSAALLLLPRSSPEGVDVGVGVGCGGVASATGEIADQASASAMRIKAEAERRKGFASRSFRGRSSDGWISVFISVIVPLFGFWFVVFVVRYPVPEIRDEVPENFRKD